jgi:threonine 3-dehydrogenase
VVEPGATMVAARFAGDCRVEVVETAVPSPGPGELLVKVDSCALCGSDRHAYRHGSHVIPGHEISGRVAALGPGVSGPAVATGGVVYLVDPCRSCAACRAGSTNMCLAKRHMYGFTADGGLAEYVVVSAPCFLPVEGVPLDAATALLDLYGTTLHAVRRAGAPLPDRLAVVGCGPIGLGAVSVAVALGIRAVHAADVSPYRLELARSLGAIELTDDIPSDGFDVVIEAAGVAETQRRAIEIAAPGGRVVMVAHSPQTLEVHVSNDLIARERALIGSEYFPVGDFGDALALLREGRLDPDRIITHRFPLRCAAEALEAFFAGRTGKVLVQPTARAAG